MRTSVRVVSRYCSAVLLAVLAACSAGAVDDTTGPDTTPVDTTGNGTVQRATLTVRVGIDPMDAGVAATAGVGTSNLTVRVERQGGAEPAKTATTNSAGEVQFTQLLQGIYTISVDRALTAPRRITCSPSEVGR